MISEFVPIMANVDISIVAA